MIEYLVPFVTGITSCGYIKLDGNNKASPFSNLYFTSLLKKANSPPSKSSLRINEQDTARGLALKESVCSV